MKAQNIVEQNRLLWVEKTSANNGLIADDNVACIEFLNSECVHVDDIAGQETWTFSDGSYVTRNEDEYWLGNDVDDFKSQYE